MWLILETFAPKIVTKCDKILIDDNVAVSASEYSSAVFL